MTRGRTRAGRDPQADELAVLDEADRRVLVTGGLSIGIFAAVFAAAPGASVDHIVTDPQRLAAAERLSVTPADAELPDPKANPYPVTANTSANPASLAATLRATWQARPDPATGSGMD